VKNADGTEFVASSGPALRFFPISPRPNSLLVGGLYKEFVQDGGCRFLERMNEPAVFDGPGKTIAP